MTQRVDFDKIEIYLVRVLQPLVTERAQLKRLRALTGDPLPATCRGMLRMAASDGPDPFLLPQWVSQLKRLAPLATSDPALARAA
jgi:hypothetical protein